MLLLLLLLLMMIKRTVMMIHLTKQLRIKSPDMDFCRFLVSLLIKHCTRLY
jgi:hypothetical protein